MLNHWILKLSLWNTVSCILGGDLMNSGGYITWLHESGIDIKYLGGLIPLFWHLEGRQPHVPHASHGHALALLTIPLNKPFSWRKLVNQTMNHLK